MKITFAEKSRLAMKRLGMTLGDLAEATDQTRQNLSNKMTRGNFSEKDMEKIAAALGCNLEIRIILPDGSEL